MKRAAAVAIVLLCAPLTVRAQVVINEFLYDASGTDADKEYIELLNTGASEIDLSKWKIFDGSNHSLNVPPKNGGTGSISIPSGGYVLLVNDAAAFVSTHSVSGTVIDTVLSLSNVSATISLLDESGATVDSVAYTKDLGAAGDGNSLQRTGSTWIAAAPTPLAANATQTAPPVEESGTTETTTATSTPKPSPVSSYVPPPVPTLFADAGDDRTVIVGADVQFDGRAYNREQEDITNVRFLWNFGDASTADGPSVLHRFEYPARYAVTLYIAQHKTSVADRLVVTAEPARLAFTVNADGSVSIENRAGRDLDLSRWIVKSFAREFFLPEESRILAGATMRIPQKTLGFYPGLETALAYPNGVTALSANTKTDTTSSEAPAAVSAPQVHAPVPAVSQSIPVARASTKSVARSLHTEEEPEPIEVATSSPEIVHIAAAAGAAPSSMYWWLGSGALAAFGGIVAVVAQRSRKGEWDIVEET